MAKVIVENLSNMYRIEKLPYNTFFYWEGDLFMKIYSPDYPEGGDYCAVWNFNDDFDGELEKNTEVLWIRNEDIEIRVLKRGD